MLITLRAERITVRRISQISLTKYYSHVVFFLMKLVTGCAVLVVLLLKQVLFNWLLPVLQQKKKDWLHNYGGKESLCQIKTTLSVIKYEITDTLSCCSVSMLPALRGFFKKAESINTLYSQLSPCGHLAITDTPLIRTAAKSPAKVTDIWLKQTPDITDSRYYGLTDTSFRPTAQFYCFNSRYNGQWAEFITLPKPDTWIIIYFCCFSSLLSFWLHLWFFFSCQWPSNEILSSFLEKPALLSRRLELVHLVCYFLLP